MGSEADAVLFRAVADLLGLGFGVLGGGTVEEGSVGSDARVELHRSRGYRDVNEFMGLA